MTRNTTAPDLAGVERIPYRLRGGAGPSNHPCTRYFEKAVRDAHGVYEALKQRLDIRPDVLAVPLVLEQQMTGDALRRLGAGESAPPKRGEPWEWTGRAKLEAVLNDQHCAEGALRFAERYARFDPAAQREAMLGRAEALLRCGEAAGAPPLAASA